MYPLGFYRLAAAAIILASSAAPALAQQTQRQPQPSRSCTLSEAPLLHGFRLGMSAAEVKKSLADSSLFDTKISSGNSVGSRAVNVSASELKEENAEAVEGVYLTFVDERLALVKVTYTSAQQWDGASDFFARTAEGLGLPKPTGPNSLRGSGGNEKYIVECGEFNATLAYSFGVSPSVTLSNTLAQQTVDKRRDKQEQGVRETKLGSVIRPGSRPLPPQTGDPHPRVPGDPVPDRPDTRDRKIGDDGKVHPVPR